MPEKNKDSGVNQTKAENEVKSIIRQNIMVASLDIIKNVDKIVKGLDEASFKETGILICDLGIVVSNLNDYLLNLSEGMAKTIDANIKNGNIKKCNNCGDCGKEVEDNGGEDKGNKNKKKKGKVDNCLH